MAEYIRATDNMRGNFDAMKKDLDESMKLCRLSFDQSNRVMFAITELLYNSIECVQHKKPFKPSPLLFATFEMLDSCETTIKKLRNAKHYHEIALIKFARSFALFLESITGYSKYQPHHQLVINAETNKVNNLLYLQRRATERRQTQMSDQHAVLSHKSIDGPVHTIRTVGQERARIAQLNRVTTAVPPSTLNRDTSPDIILPSKRSRVRPPRNDRDGVDSHKDTRQIPIMKSGSDDEMTPPILVKEGNIEEEIPLGEHSSAIPLFADVPLFSQDAIKVEESDDEEDKWSEFDAACKEANKDEHESDDDEVKKEIKEEPIEAPIADTLTFGAPRGQNALRSLSSHDQLLFSSSKGIRNNIDAPSTSLSSSSSLSYLNKGRHSSHLKSQYTTQNYKVYTHLCPFCHLRIQPIKLDEHVRLRHKDNWLTFVSKCPEAECDFRSHEKESIRKHQLALHVNTFYAGWKKTPRFTFPDDTTCPFCSRKMHDFAQFINHMEIFHSRLLTYEVSILKCATCPFRSVRCYQMVEHWIEKFPKCTMGLRFQYDIAQSLADLDANHEEIMLRNKKDARVRIPI